MTTKSNVTLEKFTVAQVATAISTLTGETVSPRHSTTRARPSTA